MRKKTKAFLSGVTLAMAVLFGAGTPALASDNYPTRPVKFLVPWPPGDLEDVLTRLIAEEMSKESGKPATVVNRAGGGGVIGATSVANSRPDGGMIGSLVVDLVTTQVQAGNTPYAMSDLEPVGIFLDYPMTLVARSDAPYNTLAELATYSQTHDVSLGHFGYEALPTAITFKAAKDVGIKFASDAPFDSLDCSTLATGDADVITANTITVLACLKSGDAKLLTSFTRNRLSISPDTPTLAEETGITITAWNGLFVRKGTPESVKEKIAMYAQKALKTDRAKDVAKSTGAGIFWIGEKEAKKVIAEDFETTRELMSSMKGK
ncbi:tripartite tricarboxylate transporter substrate binding protein [Marinobacter halodurans]|uniref:Tripartite tricarboxylate transporter substrate binding protein n=1 Tax=Marinobacter halodurans TaxID=2528979 RepID=A0ABY1ZNS7_9GAMM|nr:tripartite tricarboxylate transporter substrate binding protein [Marinobacter halodurans]TBW58171.1 tripartite tricarboxylate transporter substrate binding protein [Marinobacter halodurans]